MNIRPMILDDAVNARIAEIKAYAREHIVQLRDVVRMMGDKEMAVGNDPGFRLIIPIGYRTVFSYEWQSIGLCAHLSMSVDMPERPAKKVLPNEIAVEFVMDAFGMGKPSDAICIWVEDIDDGGLGAINVLSKVKEEQQQHEESKLHN